MPDITAPWYTIRLRSPLAAAAAGVAAGLAVAAAAEIYIYGMAASCHEPSWPR